MGNSSTTKGVRWVPQHEKWHAYIGINYRTVHIGSFDTQEEAIEARRAAEEEYALEGTYTPPRNPRPASPDPRTVPMLKSKVKGVRWNRHRSKWIATIGINHRTLHIGSYDTEQEAIAARKDAERRYEAEGLFKPVPDREPKYVTRLPEAPRGIKFDRRIRKWTAYAMIDGKRHYLGAFPTLDQAKEAKEQALTVGHVEGYRL